MKKIIISAALSFITLCAFCQNNKTVNVIVYLKNNSLLPKKITVIAYQPNETGNSTNGFFIMPGQKKKVEYTAGTRVYLANKKQVNVVMGGNRIDNDKPFIIVKKEDNERIFEM